MNALRRPYTMVYAGLVAAAVSGCTQPTGVEGAMVCEEAAAALTSCGHELEQSPFGTCQPEQRRQAEELMAVYEQGGCAGLIEGKADGWCAVPALCVDHSVEELAPFETDGCSMFPDGTRADRTLWQHCCIEHDFAYYVGGPREARREADRALRACVSTSASETLGELMYWGVRLGGTPALPTPFRWGYGWKYDPTDGYRDLPEEQLAAARAEVMAYRDDPVAPAALEQRLDALWGSIAAVPGLHAAVMEVEAEADGFENR